MKEVLALYDPAINGNILLVITGTGSSTGHVALGRIVLLSWKLHEGILVLTSKPRDQKYLISEETIKA